MKTWIFFFSPPATCKEINSFVFSVPSIQFKRKEREILTIFPRCIKEWLGIMRSKMCFSYKNISLWPSLTAAFAFNLTKFPFP